MPIGDVNASANWNARARDGRKKRMQRNASGEIRNYRNGRGSIIAPRAFVIQRIVDFEKLPCDGQERKFNYFGRE